MITLRKVPRSLNISASTPGKILEKIIVAPFFLFCNTGSIFTQFELFSGLAPRRKFAEISDCLGRKFGPTQILYSSIVQIILIFSQN